MATYLRLFSDTHLDFDLVNDDYESPDQVWSPSELPEDAESILVLAGDIWTNNLPFKVLPSGKSWIGEVARRFEHVIVVLGNHDYWGLSLQSAPRKAKEACALLPNVTVLEQDIAVIDGVKFVGGTLWTNYDNNPIAMMVGRERLNDFRKITFGETNRRRRIRPDDMAQAHRQTAKFISNNCKADVPGQPVIVVTHMAPHELSIDFDYAHESMLNLSYYTDLSKLLENHGQDIKLWVHGHIHKPADYSLYNTRVISNPRGYERYYGSTYDPHHQLEINKL